VDELSDLFEALQGELEVDEVEVCTHMIRRQAQGLACVLRSFLVLPSIGVHKPQQDVV
jgi:hypothetical protein